ncbi:MAG: SDR family oxidoreductase [Fibrobacterota bacterium]
MQGSLFDLSGRLAVVTGGTGQLGQQFSVALAEHGANVAIVDVCDSKADILPAFKTFLEAGRIRKFTADVRNRAELDKALEQISQSMGVPAILVNNAAIDSPPSAPASENGPFESYDGNSLSRILDVNVKGVFQCCQVFGGDMAKLGRGSIINIASIYGMVSPNQQIYEYKRKDGAEWYKPAAYSVSKSSLYNLTRYLATYWGRKGVRVNTLSPAGIFNNQDDTFLREYCSRIPIGRMAKPMEMNGPVVFLASDASSYMTGANLVVDGGWTAW